MEKFPSPEKREIMVQEVIDALKSKGVEDSEVFELLQRWTEQEENKTETSEAAIELNRVRARLYVEAGYVQEGLDVLEDARMQAWNEQRIELYNDIMTEMDNIEGKHQ